jgi:uncharacterized protein YqeY
MDGTEAENYKQDKIMIFDQIKSDLTTARKERDNAKTLILSTALGEMSSKAILEHGQKVVSNDVALSTIKKFIKGIDESLAIVPEDTKLQNEKVVLTAYLPQMLSNEQLTKIIQDAIDDGHAHLGGIMGFLKKNHANLYDGSIASSIAQTLLKKD